MTTLVFAAAILTAALLHEMGHAAMALARGLKIARIGGRINRGYNATVYVAIEPGTSRDQAMIAAAGPLASVAVALAFQHAWPQMANLSLTFGLLNLLIPMKGSDGWRLWKAVAAMRQAEGPR
jgi:hypothetical protein